MKTKARKLESNPLESVCSRYEEIYLIVSPPRCSSTALARVFLEHPAIGAYCHEPFDRLYYGHEGAESVISSLNRPLQVSDERRLVIKEMSFQIGKHFGEFRRLTNSPIVFLLRDPRLSIASRMSKRTEGGQNPEFHSEESGWQSLAEQVSCCREIGVPYLVVDSSDIRNYPDSVLEGLFAKLGLEYNSRLLDWAPLNVERFGGLDGAQDHWYRRVIESCKLEPANENVPDIKSFPFVMRQVVEDAFQIYETLRRDAHFVAASKVLP